MFKAIANALKMVMFFLNLWGERNRAKAKVKAEVADEIVKAFKTTDKKLQASRLNNAILNINRLR